NPDGSPDTGFGTSGRVIITGNKGADAFVTGNSLYGYMNFGFDTKPSSGQLLKYDKDGKALDSGFGTGGKLTIQAFATQFTEQADGKLLYIATSQDDQTESILYRLKTDGTPDMSFDFDGQITLTNPKLGPGDNPGGVLLLDDQGRITVAAHQTIYRF